MNLLKISLMNSKLLSKTEIRDRRHPENDKLSKVISVMVLDPLPILKEINPSKEEIDYFFGTVRAIQDAGRQFDYMIGIL